MSSLPPDPDVCPSPELGTDGDPPRLRSVISDHSSEYAAIRGAERAAIGCRLDVTPFYFWASYEGQSLHGIRPARGPLRIAALFARRPRVAGHHDARVYFKLHRELLLYAHLARGFGIEVLFGVPLVRTLMAYRSDSRCAFFQAHEDSQPGEIDAIYFVCGSHPVKCAAVRDLVGPLNDAQIARVFSRSSAHFGLDDVSSALRQLHRETAPTGSRFPFFGGVRPVYLLLQDGARREIA